MSGINQDPYPENKDSGIEWLGPIPDYWDVRQLKHVCTYNDEVLPDSTSPEYELEYVDIASVSATEGIKRTEPLRFSKSPSRARRVTRDGDVIVSTVRTYLEAIAPINNPPDNLIVSTGFAVIRPRHDLYKGFAAYSLRAEGFIKEVVSRSVGISYPAINASELVNIKVPLPPLSEQQKIADFLDYETAKIDRLIEKQQELIELLKEKRHAVISHAVTKGLNPNAPLKPSGVEWLGDVPEHWKSTAIKFCAKPGYKTFVDGDWIESPYITTDGVRLLQTGNVGIGEFREKGFRYISSETFGKLNCTEVDPGDVLICRLDGPVGRACVAPDLSARMITSVDNAILKCSDDHDAKYLVYALSSNEWLDWVKDLCRVGGGFRFRVSRSLLGDQRIPIPPIEEQKVIRDHLRGLDKRFKKLSKTAETQIQLLQERRTALISAAVTGKIDVRDWQAPTTPETEGAA